MACVDLVVLAQVHLPRYLVNTVHIRDSQVHDFVCRSGTRGLSFLNKSSTPYTGYKCMFSQTILRAVKCGWHMEVEDLN